MERIEFLSSRQRGGWGKECDPIQPTPPAPVSAPEAVNFADPGNGDLLGQLANARGGQGTGYEGCMNPGECMAKQPVCIKMAKCAVECGGFAISWARSIIPNFPPFWTKTPKD